ncbi:MAG: trypsin-like peptidase domain-containing protein [Acidimicrobiia bacterium]
MPDDGDDDEVPGEPPHPLDRVWFHPSELSGFTAAVPTRLGGREWGLAGVAALLGAIVTVVVLGAGGALDGNAGTDPSSRLSAVAGGSSSVLELVENAAPSIVSVRAVTAFGAVTGSGVAVGRTQVLTSAHLVGGLSTVTVSTADDALEATVKGVDLETDLALLIVDTRQGRNLPPAVLGSTDDLAVGQGVVAIGMTGGDHRWARPGVVSAQSRLVTTSSGVVMAGLLETDLEPGAMVGGGALLDTDGAVIGILSRAALGHALPIEVASDVADQLATGGRARHGWLGIDAVDAGDRARGGARVTAIEAGGPAAAAGIEVGDVIVVVGTDRVSDTADLAAAVSRRRPSDPVGVTLWRGDKRIHRDVDLGERMPVAG